MLYFKAKPVPENAYANMPTKYLVVDDSTSLPYVGYFFSIAKYAVSDKPRGFIAIDSTEISDIAKKLNVKKEQVECLSKKEVEDYYGFLLNIPDKYDEPAPTIDIETDPRIPEEVKKSILSSLDEAVIIFGENRQLATDAKIGSYYDSVFSQKARKAYRISDGKIVNLLKKNGERRNYLQGWGDLALATKKYVDYLKDNFCVVPFTNTEFSDKKFVINVKEEAIEAYYVGLKIKPTDRDAKIVITLNSKLIYELNGTKACYKCSKAKETQLDPFEVFNFSNKDFKKAVGSPIFVNYNNFNDFMLKNERIFSRLGVRNLLNETSETIYNMPKFFVRYMMLSIEYPSIEQIVKMGYANLYFTFMKNIENLTRKRDISEHVKEILLLIDPDSTDKKALKLPHYISKYLNDRKASFNDYLRWIDVYELTRITKEQFEKFINSYDFSIINAYDKYFIYSVPKILKYGYSLQKVSRYIIKQSAKYNIRVSEASRYLEDYLNMCGILEVTPDKYPQNIKKQHDDIVKAYKEKENEISNMRLSEISTSAYKVVEGLKESHLKIFDEYDVLFPSCQKDLLEEANQQHNCVGSYYQKIANGKSIVFFVRKKEDINESFITGECTERGLTQFFYKNNVYVNNDELRNFGKKIASALLDACKKKKINSLT